MKKRKHIELVEIAKKQYHQNIISESDNPTKKAYQIISDLTGKERKQIQITINGEKALRILKKVAELFNK